MGHNFNVIAGISSLIDHLVKIKITKELDMEDSWNALEL